MLTKGLKFGNIIKLSQDGTGKSKLIKNVLKKMLEYAKKYNSGVVKNYIPFNMRIYCDNDSTLYEIINIFVTIHNLNNQ
jgi:hypothetical protein